MAARATWTGKTALLVAEDETITEFCMCTSIVMMYIYFLNFGLSPFHSSDLSDRKEKIMDDWAKKEKREEKKEIEEISSVMEALVILKWLLTFPFFLFK